jgi:thioester reductase-like protein
MPTFTLLTGATGLLGQYLLHDLLERGCDVAVVVRPSRAADARSRVEAVMARWDRLAGRFLRRPVVLAGDLAAPGLGLSGEDRRWVGRSCSAVLHNAASLSFTTGGPRTEEPWLGNVTGTTQVVTLARELGIPKFHQVSTAYVCGLRTGRILESEGACGQQFGNDYEASKLEAEGIVRSACFPEPPTVLRPAIIVGDSRTFYTSTFHGFYTPLRVMAALVPTMAGLPPIPEAMWMAALGLAGDEAKNLVPVDWVSAVAAHIVATPRWHGQTYHLTPANRVPVREIAAVTKAAILARLERNQAGQPAAADVPAAVGLPDHLADAFRDQMATYMAYWRDDPEFDATNTATAAGHLPCPAVDAAMLRRLCDFAINANFGWPRSAIPRPAFDVERDLGVVSPPAATPPRATATRVAGAGDAAALLDVSGPGGGSWSLHLADPCHLADPGRAAAQPRLGLPESAAARVHLSSHTLAEIHRGLLTAAEAFRRGRLVVFSANGHAADLVAAIQQIASPAEGSGA